MLKPVNYFGTTLIVCTVIYLANVVISTLYEDESAQVDEWLEQNDLGNYKKLFKEHGISTLSGCSTPDQLERLPELPAVEEKRLRRAAQILQLRLVLRQWLTTHRLQHVYSKLLSLDVTSLEDVYWLEDGTARTVLDPRDFNAWSAARQSLPTGSEQLQALKTELWSTVVKNNKHQDAWAWGGMLVVSISVCGLVTLAAMTQPSLAPEAKHSLLQYVTGKYLHPPSCKVEWGWTEPVVVGQTMCFTVLFYQRNQQPYPICDTDQLAVIISHGSRKITTMVQLGSGDPAQAHTARVNFTVRTAGIYIITILIGSSAACGGPFRKCFSAGACAARWSRVARRPAALAAARCTPAALTLLPRDAHDNPARLQHANEFSIKLRTLGGEVDPALAACAQFTYDAVNERVTLQLTFDEPGIYKAEVFYQDELVKDGEFDIIVLTERWWSALQRRSASPRHMAHEARLLRAAPAPAAAAPTAAPAPAAPARGRRLLLTLSSRQLTVSDYFLKFIPKRITAFRMSPSTKLILKPSAAGAEAGAEAGAGEFSLDDGVQPRLELWSAERDLIAASFAQLLLANCGPEDTFKSKQEYFYSELRRLHARRPHERLTVRVSRADLLRSSLRATAHLTPALWCRNFDVCFAGEQGVDWGGVRREWFSLVCGELFSAAGGLFVTFGDNKSGLVHPNPDRPPHLKLKHFELAGKLVGKCLYESALGGAYTQLVRARLTRAFLAQIIGLRVHYKHFEQDDPELFLSKVRYILDTDLEQPAAVDVYFADDVYDAAGRLLETRDLIPNGAQIKVCNNNKVQYLDALAQWRLATRVRREVAAFLRGLAVLVPDNLLAVFDENELELLVCGTATISVADWRQHAVVAGGGAARARVLRWFWAAVAALAPPERARLLQFTTGAAHLPPGGFQDLNPRFQITAAPVFGALPTAHTCFNQLCLPDYDSYEQLMHALQWAINEGGEGFAMI